MSLWPAVSSVFVGSDAGGAAHQSAAGQSRSAQEGRAADAVTERPASSSVQRCVRLLQEERLRCGEPASGETALLPLLLPLAAAGRAGHTVHPRVTLPPALASVHSRPAPHQTLAFISHRFYISVCKIIRWLFDMQNLPYFGVSIVKLSFEEQRLLPVFLIFFHVMQTKSKHRSIDSNY